MLTDSDKSSARDRIARALDYRPDEGVYRLARNIFTDPEIFELEMEHIFERTWVFACHESLIPNPGDFYTVKIGRQPIIITRDRDGAIHALVNACIHRGTTLARVRKGNTNLFSCPYHAWTYRNDGQLMGVKEPGGYSADFKVKDKCLKKGVVANYRGFIFVNLDPSTAIPIEEFLGEAKRFIDLIVNQSPTGELEAVPGSSVYTYDGNWKLQNENGVDGYHVTTVHSSWVSTLANRWKLDSSTTATPDTFDATKIDSAPPGANGWFAFDNGHSVLFNEIPNPGVRAGYSGVYPRLVEQYGKDFAYWSMCKARNLGIYPSVILFDQISTQIRVVRPIAWNKTEINSYCLGVKGESPADREKRIRQFEDFFNVSGMGTPDDLVEFREAQEGFEGRNDKWSDISRGHAMWSLTPTPAAQAIQVKPALSGPDWSMEGIFVKQHKRWQDLLLTRMDKPSA